MVVKSRSEPLQLDLGYLALFLGLRFNQLVMERFRAMGLQHVRESHGYVIQHLIERQRSITELAQRMEVTQQAASKAVREMVKLGILELVPGADRRSKTVTLSPRGWTVVRLGRKIRRQIERRLIRTLGPDYDAAKSILSAALEALGGLERVRTRRVLSPQ
jgi:DNA-binding MarR family transcriptional regulator